ncbi:hypothetical protein VULLAG_LOCUS4005 [Vulpes lagopus]
MSERTQPR